MLPLTVGLLMVLHFPLPVMGVDGGGGEGAGGVDVEEVPRPKIKCCQYLASMEKCTHILSAPFLSTPGMMIRRL